MVISEGPLAAKWPFAVEACDGCLGLIWGDKSGRSAKLGERLPLSKVTMGGGLPVPTPGSCDLLTSVFCLGSRAQFFSLSSGPWVQDFTPKTGGTHPPQNIHI